MNDAELLREIEALIEDFRWARSDSALPEHKTWLALKQIAGDIRGRQPLAAVDAITALEKRIESVGRIALSGNDHDAFRRAMAGLGEELRGRWPTVRQALEQFAKEGAKA